MSIHPTAVIHERATIAEDCKIGPYCIVGEHVTLASACQLHSHVVIEGHTDIVTSPSPFEHASRRPVNRNS